VPAACFKGCRHSSITIFDTALMQGCCCGHFKCGTAIPDLTACKLLYTLSAVLLVSAYMPLHAPKNLAEQELCG
jgi:hypothetical protein